MKIISTNIVDTHEITNIQKETILLEIAHKLEPSWKNI